MAKQEPENESGAVSNNAKHENELLKPYDEGNTVTSASKF